MKSAKMPPLREEPIDISPYDASWPARFEEERLVLARVLQPWLNGGIDEVRILMPTA